MECWNYGILGKDFCLLLLHYSIIPLFPIFFDLSDNLRNERKDEKAQGKENSFPLLLFSPESISEAIRVLLYFSRGKTVF
jgi:hypothetical protein